MFPKSVLEQGLATAGAKQAIQFSMLCSAPLVLAPICAAKVSVTQVRISQPLVSLAEVETVLVPQDGCSRLLHPACADRYAMCFADFSI